MLLLENAFFLSPQAFYLFSHKGWVYPFSTQCGKYKRTQNTKDKLEAVGCENWLKKSVYLAISFSLSIAFVSYLSFFLIIIVKFALSYRPFLSPLFAEKEKYLKIS